MDRANLAMGMHNENRHVLLSSKPIDGCRSGITTRRADHGRQVDDAAGVGGDAGVGGPAAVRGADVRRGKQRKTRWEWGAGEERVWRTRAVGEVRVSVVLDKAARRSTSRMRARSQSVISDEERAEASHVKGQSRARVR